MGCLPRLWSRLRNRLNRKRTRLWTRQRSLGARNLGYEASNHELQRTIQSNNKGSETALTTRLSASLKNNTYNKVTGAPPTTNVANNEAENEIENQGSKDSEIAEIVPYSEAEHRYDKILSSKDEATLDLKNDLGEQEIYPYPTQAELEESVEIEVILSSNSPQSGARKYQAGKYIGEVEDNMNSREKKADSDNIEYAVQDLRANNVQDVNDNRVNTSTDLITYNEARSDSKGDHMLAVNHKKDVHLLDDDTDIDDVRFSGSTVKSDPFMTTSYDICSSANEFDSNNTNDQNAFLTKDTTAFKNRKGNEKEDNHDSGIFKIEHRKEVQGDKKIQIIQTSQEAKIRDNEESDMKCDSNSSETVAVSNVKDDSVNNESEDAGTEHESENFIEEDKNNDDNANKESSEEHTTGSEASADDDDDDDDDDNDDDDDDDDEDDDDEDDGDDDDDDDDDDEDDDDDDDSDADDSDADDDDDTDVGDDDDNDSEGDSKKGANDIVDDDDDDDNDDDDHDDHDDDEDHDDDQVLGDVVAINRQNDAKDISKVGASEEEKKSGRESELENTDCKETKGISYFKADFHMSNTQENRLSNFVGQSADSAEQGASGFGNPSTESCKHTIINNDIEVTLIDEIP